MVSYHNKFATSVRGYVNSYIIVDILGVSMLLPDYKHILSSTHGRTLEYVSQAYQIERWGPAHKQ